MATAQEDLVRGEEELARLEEMVETLKRNQQSRLALPIAICTIGKTVFHLAKEKKISSPIWRNAFMVIFTAALWRYQRYTRESLLAATRGIVFETPNLKLSRDKPMI